MGTRGLYGLRKNGIDKTSYNHFDSYPEGLGNDILKFIKNHTIEDMNHFYDRIIMVSNSSIPTAIEVINCKIDNEAVGGTINLDVGNRSINDWYCLLRELQGDLEKLSKCGWPYMIDDHDFIKDSLYCEYAYIINLDTNMLEFYKGFQHKPQEGNRYGDEPLHGDILKDAYYPCALIAEIPITLIQSVDTNEIIKKFMSEDEE